MKGFLIKSYLQHQLIFSEGDKGENAYVLSEGRVEISNRINGRKKVLAVLKPITVFGEMALFMESQKRTATAIALDDCKVVVVNKENIDEYIKDCPPVIASVMQVLVQRLSTASKKSLQVPNLYTSLAQIIQLMLLHNQSTIFLDDFLHITSLIFITPQEDIQEQLNILAGNELIEFNTLGGRKILIPKNTTKLKELSKTAHVVGAAQIAT